MFFRFHIDTPSLDIHFVYNNVKQKVNVKLPLTLNKFFEPTEMNGESFFARWKNLGGFVFSIGYGLFIVIIINFDWQRTTTCSTCIQGGSTNGSAGSPQ